jgi:alpha-methylacyl-CoA racemase
MSVGCIERQFFTIFLETLQRGLPQEFSLHGWRPSAESHMNQSEWPNLRKYICAAFRMNTRDYWGRIFDGGE